ncbi:MAG: DUF1684 domain-containing protein [Cyclobacteriaceae bacterium]|nr:DUF1684 domain-containing protein [Cyclobacteriaceae bacterium]MCH8516836.1 DUF1684 domain-containing protein [Cyclobacteriaceae bacterium]
MKRNHILILIVAVGVLASFWYATKGDETAEEYTARIQEEHRKKFVNLKHSRDSPLREEVKLNMRPMRFFEPNPQYKVKARLEKLNPPKAITVDRTDGKASTYYEFAIARFELDGVPQELMLWKDPEDDEENRLFLAFYDATSADRTYGGGRYLDLVYKEKHFIEMDFNLSYNPYCAYDESFSCPIPPRKNEITVPVEAGELDYKADV